MNNLFTDIHGRGSQKSSVWNRFFRKATLLLLILTILWSITPSSAWAFEVPKLPGDNLIQNPWFRRASNPSLSGLDGWIDAAGLNQDWSSSQKESNPSPEIVVAGPCGNKQVYCGTAARLSPNSGQSGGVGLSGDDAYLYQVVEADKSHRKLKFFMHWVSHLITADITIYGSDSPDGDWSPVWVPFNHFQDSSPPPPRGGQAELWTQTEFLETVISDGYPFYKIEVHAVLADSNSTGFKFTGIYFATEFSSDPADPLPLITAPTLPTPESTAVPTTRSRTPVWTATPLPEPTSTPTLTPDTRPTQTSPTAIAPTETLTPMSPSGPGTEGGGFWGSIGISSFWGGVVLGAASAGVILLIVLFVSSKAARRKPNL